MTVTRITPFVKHILNQVDTYLSQTKAIGNAKNNDE